MMAMLGALLPQVLTQLPAKRRQQVYLHIGKSEMSAIKTMQSQLNEIKSLAAKAGRNNSSVQSLFGTVRGELLS